MTGQRHPGRQAGLVCSAVALILTAMSACLPARTAVAPADPTRQPSAGSRTAIASATQGQEEIPTSAAQTIRSSPTSPPPPAPSPVPHSTSEPLPPAGAAAEVCSPLEGIPLGALPEIISNPYKPSRTGKDDGHPALDFAFYHWRSLKDISGHPVLALMEGSIAGLGFNRLPYGNMVIIETPWETAPVTARQVPGAGAGGSIYVLYAHLQDAPELNLGERAGCGQALGRAGQTGRSGAPHLHLEVRWGPAGTQFTPMVFYDSQASEEQMESYRLWSMSGVFAGVDPLTVIGLAEIP